MGMREHEERKETRPSPAFKLRDCYYIRSNTVENPNSSGEAVKTAPNRNGSGSVSVQDMQDTEDMQSRYLCRFNMVDPI